MSTNGTGNGHDPDRTQNKPDKIVKFPTLAERDRMRREERKAEERWRKDYKKRQKAHTPAFFNFGRIPPFTKALVATMIAAHLLLYLALDHGTRLQIFYTFGFIPSTFSGSGEFPLTPLALITPLSHILIHGGWMHIFFNTVMGLALGMMFERTHGPRKTAIFFILCTIIGAATYFIFNMHANTPLIGASGGVSGLFGAALIIMMQQNPHNPMMKKFGKKGPWPILIFWGLFMIVMGMLAGGNMAWEAHIGGYITGIILLTGMQRGTIKF